MKDRFHQLFPDRNEPKLPIHIYSLLLDIMTEDSAFDLLCSYEQGSVSLSEIKNRLEPDCLCAKNVVNRSWGDPHSPMGRRG